MSETSAVPAVPAHAAANHRRSVLIAAPLGVVALAVCAALGHPLAGLFVVLGLAMGAGNTYLVQRSVARFAGSGDIGRRKRFVGNTLSRLAVITLIAVVIMLLVRPDGFGVVGGLAIFQLLMVGNASLPVIKELRKT